MDDSIAILGRQPALGLAELESLYGSDKITPLGTQAARISIMPCSIDFSRLGGTVKLCKLLAVLETTEWQEVENFLVTAAPGHSERMPKGKMHLGLSAYGSLESPQRLMATALRLKRVISKYNGRSVHIVPNKASALATAQVLHNKLLTDNGWELVIVRDGQRFFIAQTLFIQDIKSYTKRDRERPKRDARTGMLPPKLAQIIVNLAAATTPPNIRSVVLDPFCGTGVVLQEALLTGFGAYGTDRNERMLTFTRQNLEWLSTIATPQKNNVSFWLETADATTTAWSRPFHLLATETYLGRPFTTRPSSTVLAQTVADCNTLIKKFLGNLHPQITPQVRLCVAVPAWQITSNEFQTLPLIDHLQDIGYNRIRFQHVRDEELFYYRERQFVARQLLVLTKRS